MGKSTDVHNKRIKRIGDARLNTFVWIAFGLLTAAEIFIVCHFARTKETALIKAVVPSYLLFALVFILAAVFSLRIQPVLWLLAMAALFLHTFAGYYLRLYEKSKVFDRYSHAYASFANALLVYSVLTAIFGVAAPKFLAAVLVFTLGVTLGVFVEIFEFMSDMRGKLGIKMQKGIQDTNYDLIFDVMGSFLAAIFSYFVLI